MIDDIETSEAKFRESRAFADALPKRDLKYAEMRRVVRSLEPVEAMIFRALINSNIRLLDESIAILKAFGNGLCCRYGDHSVRAYRSVSMLRGFADRAKKQLAARGIPRTSYQHFTDGMQAAAEICGTLAETVYDDADSFEAATGCEAEIMKVVRYQRKEQEEIKRN